MLAASAPSSGQEGVGREGDSALRFDVIVVGMGVAGLVAALDIRDADPSLSVAMIDKGPAGTSGSTPLAQGGLAAPVGPEDSPARHAADTVAAGDGLCDRQAVELMTSEASARVDDLVARGVRFDRDEQGRLSLAREAGHSVARGVRAADATGAEIFRALREAASGRVTRLQGAACALGRTPRGAGVGGVWVALDEAATGPVLHGSGLTFVQAGRVVLATGGCGGLYAATTNRDGVTGDGVALAMDAGAAVLDMEFVQFHPTGLRTLPEGATATRDPQEPFRRLLLTEALRGAGARLVNTDGRRFMVDRHPDAELAPRHVVTKGIMEQPGGAWLDATGLAPEVLERDFPTVVAGARQFGYDLATEPVPVEPCEHYMIGGVATDLSGRTTVPGLYAAGEVACTGVHGANRMAGNSLTQSCVFGHRTAQAVVSDRHGPAGLTATSQGGPAPPALPRASEPDLTAVRTELREAMSDGAGPIRTAASLGEAAKALDAAADALASETGEVGSQPDRAALELAHLVTIGRLIVRNAGLRSESRGVHWRDDAPAHDPAWSGLRLQARGGS